MEKLDNESPDEAERHRQFLSRASERMAEMNRLQQAWWDELQRSPEKYAEYMARNFKKRAMDENGVYCDPEARMLQEQGKLAAKRAQGC
jgi:hypothetical protein